MLQGPHSETSQAGHLDDKRHWDCKGEQSWLRHGIASRPGSHPCVLPGDGWVPDNGFATWGFECLLPGTSGWVTDSRDKSKIPGVTVRIVGGPNAGRTTTTGTDGAYQLYDLEPGALTVVFSKPGFATVSFLYSLPGDRFVSLDAMMDSLAP